jgi:glucokinase
LKEVWAIGVDLGGTKLEAARVDEEGKVLDSVRMATRAREPHLAVEEDIVAAVRQLEKKAGSFPIGVGIGMAGQIDGSTGQVHFAPNLGWHDVPLRVDLEKALELPVVVTNDVRAVTLGEWLHGTGRDCDDLVCLYVGTGIGGGVVTGGRLLSGSTNSAGELGHVTIDLDGPVCTCGNYGCMEALAGGWAIARQARELVSRNPEAGGKILSLVGGSVDSVTAKTVAVAAGGGDGPSIAILEDAGRALAAGCVSLVNVFNPSRLILGGGVIDGVPWLIDRVREGVTKRALPAATGRLQVLASFLGAKAGAVGAASLALRMFGGHAGRA